MGGKDGPHEQVGWLHDTLSPLLDLDAAPAIVNEADPPSLETVGALSSTLAKLRFDLQYALDSVRDMERFRDAVALEADSRKRQEASGDGS